MNAKPIDERIAVRWFALVTVTATLCAFLGACHSGATGKAVAAAHATAQAREAAAEARPFIETDAAPLQEGTPVTTMETVGARVE